MIELLRAGPLTTVQDLGREAWRDRGISRCGMLDDLALIHANLLVGNAPGAAGLEFTLGPATLRLHADGDALTLSLPRRWLEARPLLHADLADEPEAFAALGIALRIEAA